MATIGAVFAAYWLWFLLVFIFGAVMVPALSFLAGPALPKSMRDPLGRIWGKLALATFGTSIIIRTTDGNWRWHSADYDPEVEAFELRINGEKQYLEDKIGAVGTLFKEKFGLGYEGLNAVLDPALAKVGENHAAEVRADGGDKEGRWVYDASGNVVSVNEYLRVDDDTELVDMSTVMDIVQHAGSPALARRTEERAKISQAKFSRGEKAAIGVMLLGGVALGAGIVYFSMGGGGAVNVPVPGLMTPGWFL